jgi:biofilm PGA synthesis protein PgaA
MTCWYKSGVVAGSCCIALGFSGQAQAAPQVQADAKPASFSAYSPLAHDRLIAALRAGQLSPAQTLAQLAAWQATAPDAAARARLQSDRVVVAAQNGEHALALAAAREAGVDALAPYALEPLMAAARAGGDTALQGQTVARFAALNPGSWQARVHTVMWQIDSRDLAGAQRGLDALAAAPRGTTAQRVAVLELRGALAEAREDTAAALRHYQDLLTLDPDHRHALRSEVLLTAQLGSPGAALVSAQPNLALFSALELAGLRQAALGERLRWALSQRDQRPNDPQRFDALDAMLRDAQTLATTLTTPPPATDAAGWQRVQVRLDADRVMALFERGRYAETLALHTAMTGRYPAPLPWYATAAAAGAHAQLRRPDLAVPLYEAALRDGGAAVRVPSDIHVGLVYAYLDTARFTQADALLADLMSRTPPLLALSPEAGRPNDDYANLLGLRALVALYTDRLDQAEQDFNQLAALAPMNAAYGVGQARVLRARDKPDAALRAFESALANQPESLDAQAGYAEALFDTGDLRAARLRVNALARQHPDNASVRSAVRTRDTVMSPRLDVDLRAGRDGGTLSNRDATLQARLSSGWRDDSAGHNWRVYGRQWLGRADTGGSKVRAARSGLGLDWQVPRWRLQAELHQSTTDPRRTGLALAAGWHASDHWRLSAHLDSNAWDIPWRARQAGTTGREVGAGVTYVVNESRRFAVQAQQTHYSDANRRNSAGASWYERWYSGPRLQLQTTLASDTARNALQNVPYFSPSGELGVALDARAQWLTWKRDDRRFVQALEAGTGRYRQDGFGGGATQHVRYAHEWAWGPGNSLRYGLGSSVHPYDGVRERRHEVFVQFSMALP